MKKVMTTQETTKENKTYVRPTMEIYPMCVECQVVVKASDKTNVDIEKNPNGTGDGND